MTGRALCLLSHPAVTPTRSAVYGAASAIQKGRVYGARRAGASPRSKRETQQGTPIQLSALRPFSRSNRQARHHKPCSYRGELPPGAGASPWSKRETQQGTHLREGFSSTCTHMQTITMGHMGLYNASATLTIQINPLSSMLDTQVRHQRPKYSACPSRSSQLVIASAFETGEGFLRGANHVLGC
jgi:hypothetical protein